MTAPSTQPSHLALRALFAAYVAATIAHIAIVVAHEPFAFDAWNVAIDTHGEPWSLRRWLSYGAFEYQHANPRIGQWLTYLSYKLSAFVVIATPLAYLALATAVTALGLGRLPSWRRGRDLMLWAIAIGSLWFALPSLGMIMFCRAYATNYVYGAATQLWFVYALLRGRDRPATVAAMIGNAVLGAIAGMSNEHTGPTLVLFALGFVWWTRAAPGEPGRREGGHGDRSWRAWAGTGGLCLGFAVIFFAPGQGERYDGLANKVGLVGRLLQRGVLGNLDILGGFVLGAAPVLAMIAIALVMDAWRDGASPPNARRQQALRFLGCAMIAGTLVTATVFVSPKLGPRFYLHSCALLLAAFLRVLDAIDGPLRRRLPYLLVAVFASGYAAERTIGLFLRLDVQSDARLATLTSSPVGGTPTIESFDQVEPSWWFLGDDLRTPHQRGMVGGYLGLSSIVYRAVDLDAPLGVTDVRLVPHVQLSPPGCLEDHGGFEITGYRGLDVASIQRAMLAGVARTQQRLGGARLDQLELAVELIGDPPKLPRKKLLIGRWRPERFVAYAGLIERRGVGRTRSIVLPRELRNTDLEIYAYHLGGPSGGDARRLGTARDAKLEYAPWARGGYWALACDADECFVFAATRAL